jgi:CRP-like cAMP-binding protein
VKTGRASQESGRKAPKIWDLQETCNLIVIKKTRRIPPIKRKKIERKFSLSDAVGGNSMEQFDMRAFAKGACPTITLRQGTVLFHEGDPSDCVYLIHSGSVEMICAGKVVDACGSNDTFGFMSVIDHEPRALTARVKEDAELSVIDHKKFQFMVHQLPNFPFYIMQQMAGRIKKITHVV